MNKTLSDKIVSGASYGERPMFRVEDVKEFIEEIKRCWASTQWMTEKKFNNLQIQIDNITGDKLQ